MFNITRRQAFATSGGVLATLLAPVRHASAAVGNTLNIAYNVNLPSFDPDVGPSSVNPTIQAIYRSVFDQYVGQKPNLAFEPGLLTGLAQRLARNRSTVPPFDPAQAFDRESFIDGGLTPASIFFTIFFRPSRKTAVSGGARPGRRYR